MAGPGGREAGRISIRVLPDTRNFATSLQRYLDRVEKRSQLKINVEADMDQFSMDVRTQLAAMEARYRLNIRADANMERFSRNVRNQVRAASERYQVNIRANVDRDSLRQATRAFGLLNRSGGGGGGAARSTSGILLKLAAAASTATPQISALVGGLAQMAPVAAVAAPALLGLATAGGALAIGLKGVGAALGGDADALAKLTPAARDFVKQTKALAPAWDKVHDAVQSNLFKGLGDTLTKTAKVILPVLKKSLGDTAKGLNGMAKEVLRTSATLGKNGQLGKALDGANDAFKPLMNFPAQFLDSLVKLSIAAAPTLERMTSSISDGMDSLIKKMTKGLKSGGLEGAISHAADLAVQLGGFLKDVGKIFTNVFGPAAEAGAGVGATISGIADSLAKLTGTDDAQKMFKDLFETLSEFSGAVSTVFSGVASAVLPIIESIVSNLAGPLQSFFAKVGPLLSKLAGSLGKAIGPVIGVLSKALAALMPVLSTVVSMLVESLSPVLEKLGPLFAKIGTAAMSFLMPILQQLPAILKPSLDLFAKLSPILIKLADQFVTQLTPSMASLGKEVSKLLIALSPVVSALGSLMVSALKQMMPALITVIKLVTMLATYLVDKLVGFINAVVIPAINVLRDIFKGNFSDAAKGVVKILSGLLHWLNDLMAGIGRTILRGVLATVRYFGNMAKGAINYVREMAAGILAKIIVGMSNFKARIAAGLARAVNYLRSLPSKAKSAVGNLGNVLVDAGKALLRGFIHGIASMIGALKSKLGGITSMLPDWKGPAELDARILTPNGQLLMDGFMHGIEKRLPGLRKQLGNITGDLPAMLGTAEFAGAEYTAPRGIQPGDTFILSPDGKRKFEMFLSDRLDADLVNSADLGRRIY